MANIYVNDIIKRAQDDHTGYVVEAENVDGLKPYAYDSNVNIPFDGVTGIQSYVENYIKNNVIIKVNGNTISPTGIHDITFDITI